MTKYGGAGIEQKTKKKQQRGGCVGEQDVSTFLLWADRRVDQAFYDDLEAAQGEALFALSR